MWFILLVMARKRILQSEQETRVLARKLLRDYFGVITDRALLFALRGELGTGKTVFAKGIGEALGVRRPVRSPSFVLVAEYPFESGRFFHVDLWRVESEKEVRSLKIEDMIKPGNVILIEWVQKMPGFLAELRRRDDLKVVEVRFECKGGNERELRIYNY